MTEQIQRAPWTTNDEKKYISGIVTRVGASKAPAILRGYIKASQKRVRWGYIQKHNALRFAEGLLESLTGGA